MKTNSVIGNHSIAGLDQFRELAVWLAEQLCAGDIVLLVGDLGAGKTTFTQSLGQALGVRGRITSPTYTLIAEYATENNSDIARLVHMDLYRMKQFGKQIPLSNEYVQEVIREASGNKAIIVIEWAEMMKHLPKDGYWSVAIKQGNTPQGRSVIIRRVQ